MVRGFIKKLHPDAGMMKFNKYDAGYDVLSIKDLFIRRGDVVKIRTGLIVSVPIGYELQIRDRSHIVTETPLRIEDSPATIDAGFIDEIMITIWNNPLFYNDSIYNDRYKDNGFLIKKGDRIAQFVFKKLPEIELVYVDDINKVVQYTRKKRYNTNGYGSTGLNEDGKLYECR